jgi:phage terminase large subunit GpA-like protein
MIKTALSPIIRKYLEPPAKLNPWQWAESNIEIKSTIVSPLLGKYSTSSMPYVREVLEAFADPEVKQITLCWSAQSSKTMTIVMGILYSIANNPGNCLFVRPSAEAARTLNENKIIPLINTNPCLTALKTGVDDDFKKGMIKFKDMVVFVKGANPNQLSAESCMMVILDETDKYDPYNADKEEADLVSLAFERVKFYTNHKKIATSTPTVPTGTIWRLYQKGDQRAYMLPCPGCGVEFKLEQKLLRYAETDDEAVIAESAHIECPHCQQSVYDRDKHSMLLAGRWVAQNDKASPDHRSYHLSEFYSPLTKWGDLAVKFVRANREAKTGDFGSLHNYVNSSLAEPWNPTENNRYNREILEKLCDARPEGIVPDEARGLTIGIDTQDELFWFSVRAWGYKALESWQVMSGQLVSFQDIERVLYHTFQTVSGRPMRIYRGLMDSGGHRAAEVYEFCRKHRAILYASKGASHTMQGTHKITRIDRDPQGRPLKSSIKLINVNTTLLKDLLAGKLALPANEAGAFHLHSTPGDEYFAHMTVEYRNEKGVWCCPNHARNDMWDCEVLNFCCAYLQQLNLIDATATPPTPPAATTTAISAPAPAVRNESDNNDDDTDNYNASRWRQCIGR